MSIEEIKENGFNLNISRYVSSEEEEEIIDLAQVKKSLDETEKNKAQ